MLLSSVVSEFGRWHATGVVMRRIPVRITNVHTHIHPNARV